MPAVLPAAFGCVAGLLAALLLPVAPGLLAPLASIASLAAWRGWPRLAVMGAGLAGGAVVGGLEARSARRDCRFAWEDGERVALVVEPRDLPALGSREFHVVWPERCRGRIRLALPAGDTSAGRRVVAGSWRRAPGAVPARPFRAGVLVVRRTRPAGGSPGLRHRLRLAAERRLVELFGPERSLLAAALTVSPDVRLPDASRQPFARAGLAHILSISGFHVGILAGVLVLLLRAARAPPDAARLGAVPLVAGYVWLLGVPAPALRAALLLGLWAWARARQRPVAASSLVAASALALSLADPAAVMEPGPWLSFAGAWGCMAASRLTRLIAEQRRGPVASRRVLRAEPLAASAGALLATSPITALAFGSLTPAALVANLAAVPAAAFAIPSLMLALVLASSGWQAGSGVAAAAAGVGLEALERVAVAAGSHEWSRIEFASRLPVAATSAAVALLLLTGARRARRGAASRLGARCALALAVTAAAAAAAGCADSVRGWHRSGNDGGVLALHFLAVGQGDAVAIRTPRGRWILVDGGPRTPRYDAGRSRVTPFLRRSGARELAVMIASHGDADHMGGVPAVLEALPARLALEPGEALGRPLYREFLAAAARRGAEWHPARAGDSLVVDGVTLRVWHPDAAWLERREAANENSVVLTAEYGAFRALLPGDAGLPMEHLRGAPIGDVTLLKVGHHGSRGATGAGWLLQVRPEVCIVSVGPNRYGHPDRAVMERLSAAGCAAWRTDRDGDVTVRTDGRTMAVRASGGRWEQFTITGEVP